MIPLGHAPRQCRRTVVARLAPSVQGWFAALTVALASLSACGSPDSDFVVRTDSAGVEIVTHTGPDVALDWTFDPAFTLGGKETEPESFYSLNRSTVAVGPDGAVFVLDTDAKRVVVFDSTGTLLRTMGGDGGGPGEMRFPIALALLPDGSVGVFDIGKRGFVRFGTDGRILDEMPVTFGYGGDPIHTVRGQLVTAVSNLDRDRSLLIDAVIAIAGDDTTRIVTVERPAGGVVTLASCGMQFNGMPPIFAPSLRWSPDGDGLFVATDAAYAISLYRDGRLSRIIRRELEPVVATEAAARAQVGDRMRVMAGGGVRTCDTDEVVEQRGFADVIPIIAALAKGPDGTLWVRRAGGPGNPQPVDVFDAAGTYLGSLPPDAPFPVAVLGDRMAAIETDDMDVDRLVMYRVRR